MTTYAEVIRAGYPNCPQDECEYILWERTPYPMGGDAKGLYRAASGWFRAGKNKRRLCTLCDNQITKDRWECESCTRALRPREVRKESEVEA